MCCVGVVFTNLLISNEIYNNHYKLALASETGEEKY